MVSPGTSFRIDVRTHQFDIHIGSKRDIPERQECCYTVGITRVSDGRKWVSAIHFVSGITSERVASRIQAQLIAALEVWDVDTISFVFEIPKVIIPKDPVRHTCHYFPPDKPRA